MGMGPLVIVIAVILMLAAVLPTTTNMLSTVTSPGVNATQGVSQPFIDIVRLLPLLVGVSCIAIIGWGMLSKPGR